jgi:regulation of enolase protein 1 (concanavalin A-like superfamily)
VSAGKGNAFQRRPTNGGQSLNTPGSFVKPPYWVRMRRQGTAFQAFESPDGKTWRLIGQQTIAMNQTIYAGLAVTSHHIGARTTVKFSQVNVIEGSTSSSVTPTVSLSAPAAGATFQAPASITVSANASATSGSISSVDFYAGSMLIGSDTSAPYSITWPSAAAGTYALTAVARHSSGTSGTSAARTITVSATQGLLPAPWASADIGSPALTGSATYGTGTFTVKAAGTDIFNSSDQFRFVYQLFTGDGDVTARIDSVSAADSYSKAGVMMRESLSASSSHAFTLLTASRGVRFARRPTPGGASLTTTGTNAAPPYWVRLRRQGDTFQAFESSNGTTWRLVGQQAIAMSQTIYAGLAVTSHNVSVRTTATISQIAVVETGAGTVTPTVSLTSPAAGASFTAPTSIAVGATASATSGSISRVDFYVGSTLIGSDTAAPYAMTWSNPAIGTHALTAVATHSSGTNATSAAVSVTVKGANNPPSVTLTSPAAGATFPVSASVSLSASASDPDGSIVKVDFLVGSTVVGTDTTSPYSLSWNAAAAGTLTITARATDNGGAVATSSGVAITVSSVTGPLKTAVFTASADHNTLVTSYRLDIFAAGADPSTATPKATRNLGKPAPVNGEISVDISTTLAGLPAGTYFATVSAVNGTGSSRSAPSATFTY